MLRATSIVILVMQLYNLNLIDIFKNHAIFELYENRIVYPFN